MKQIEEINQWRSSSGLLKQSTYQIIKTKYISNKRITFITASPVIFKQHLGSKIYRENIKGESSEIGSKAYSWLSFGARC